MGGRQLSELWYRFIEWRPVYWTESLIVGWLRSRKAACYCDETSTRNCPRHGAV